MTCFIPMRMQPLHNGHLYLIREAISIYPRVIIGIGSSNKTDLRNPIPAEERREILINSLKDEKIHVYKIILIEDQDDDKKWVADISTKIPSECHVFTGNPLVGNIMRCHGFKIRSPPEILKDNICATMIRDMIKNGDDKWKGYGLRPWP